MRSTPTSYSRSPITYASFKRSSWSVYWPFSTISTAGFYRTVSPTLSSLSNASEYTSLFDAYKVKKVTITFLPRFGETVIDAADDVPQTVNHNQFYMTVGTDRNNFTTPTGTYANSTYNDFLQRVDNVKVFKLDKPITYSYKPNIRASTAGGESIIPCPWISTANANEPLLGSMAFIHDSNFQGTYGLAGPAVDLIVTLEFVCKGNR